MNMKLEFDARDIHWMNWAVMALIYEYREKQKTVGGPEDEKRGGRPKSWTAT